MLSQLDNIIFPDRCDVLEIVPSQRYVYPIYKNGSSSLYNSGFRRLEHDELKKVTVIDIYVRNPHERFVTGVNSFLKYNQNLDRTTALHFITNYLFLNRHFCPQFYWLVNLQRFSQAKIQINPIESISEITNLKYNTNNSQLIDDILNLDKVHFYLSIDKVLTEDLINKTVPFEFITKTIKHRYPEIHKEIVQRSINLGKIINV